MVERHLRHTGSTQAKRVLDNWELMVPRFVKVMPTDYKRVLQARRAAKRPTESIAEQLQQTAGAGGRA
jgi:glutamate synthase (NADPH/NADH) large chain